MAVIAKESAPAIRVGEPEGFANLTSAQVMLVDVYYGGVRQGEARISAAPGTMKFLDPSATISFLPELTDRNLVEAALSANSISTNAPIACSTTTDPKQCGQLFPDVIGVILDRDHFRLDIFVNPRFLAVQDNVAESYLPEPDKGLAVVNAFGAILTGELGENSPRYNIQDSLIVGSGERRLRADLSQASGLGFGVERLAFEWDRPGLRYSAGTLWAPGTEISGRRKLLGAGIETQIDTRLDKDEIFGSPLVVYLDRRARVDILRDGRILNSTIYEAGNQQLDTSGLPDGSYDVILRIEEPGKAAREERRFFTKNRRIPSLGRTDFFAFGGFLADEIDRQALNPSSHPYFQAGAIRRLSANWALDSSIAASDEEGSAEIGVTFLSPIVQIRTAGVAGLDGMYGAIVQLGSAGTSRLSFNFDMRMIETGNDSASAPGTGPANPFDLLDPVGPGGSFTQVGGVVSFSLANLRILGTGFYRDDKSEEARYSIGPSVEWDVFRKGPYSITLRGDMVATERGKSGFVGISLRVLNGGSTVSTLGGVRKSSIGEDDLGEGPVAAVSGGWSPNVGDGELSVGAGFEHQPNEESVIASADYRSRLGSVSGDLVRNDKAGRSTSQYTVGFQTTMVAGAGTVTVAGKTTSDSMVVARVTGARVKDRFDLIVNEQVIGTIIGQRPYTIALPAYRAYQVRIRPTGEDLLAYDNSAREIGLYPGAVAKLDWTVAPITIKFGRLLSPDGTPVANASISGKGVWSETDADGYFQVEAPEGAELQVTLRDGRVFDTLLPPGDRGGNVARIGSVVCCGESEFRLGNLEPIGNVEKGTQQ